LDLYKVVIFYCHFSASYGKSLLIIKYTKINFLSRKMEEIFKYIYFSLYHYMTE